MFAVNHEEKFIDMFDFFFFREKDQFLKAASLDEQKEKKCVISLKNVRLEMNSVYIH